MIKQAIRLESSTSYARYLAIATTEGQDDKEESVILGFHCADSIAYLGLVLPIYRNTEITLDGDGLVIYHYSLLASKCGVILLIQFY